MVASKIILFLFSSNREPLYKSISYSVIVGRAFKIRNNWFYTIHKIVAMLRKVLAVQKVMFRYLQFSNCRNIKDLDSLENYDGILCSLRWLMSKQRRVSNFKPIGSKMLYMLLWFGRMKDKNLHLNNEIDSWVSHVDI